MSTADQLVRQLCELGESAEVSITKQKSGWFVAVRPQNKAPLWWCASKPTLELALQSCKDQAIELGLIPKEVDPEKEILKQTTLYMVSVSEFVEAGKLAREDWPEKTSAVKYLIALCSSTSTQVLATTSPQKENRRKPSSRSTTR